MTMSLHNDGSRVRIFHAPYCAQKDIRGIYRPEPGGQSKTREHGTAQYPLMLDNLAGALISAIPVQAGVEDQIRVGAYILWAMALGGVIGLEREKTAKAPGLRTHMLIAGASAMIVAIGFSATNSLGDPSRSIHGIVTGIGFLCAGAIFQSKKGAVSGLTTAASMLYTATIGCAIGAGFGYTATMAALLALLVLRVLGHMRYKMTHHDNQTETLHHSGE